MRVCRVRPANINMQLVGGTTLHMGVVACWVGIRDIGNHYIVICSEIQHPCFSVVFQYATLYETFSIEIHSGVVVCWVGIRVIDNHQTIVIIIFKYVTSDGTSSIEVHTSVVDCCVGIRIIHDHYFHTAVKSVFFNCSKWEWSTLSLGSMSSVRESYTFATANLFDVYSIIMMMS